jgi:hypothetical protein
MRIISGAVIALLLSTSLVFAQNDEPPLNIKRSVYTAKEKSRTSPSARIGRDDARARLGGIDKAIASEKRALNRERDPEMRAAAPTYSSAAAPRIQSFGTGGGDVAETEPNDSVAQAVSLPVNIFGRIRFNQDVDFFAFQGLSGEQVTIEAFAARYTGSELIAEIALFNSAGTLLSFAIGDEISDPIIRYVPSANEVFIVGITDADNFGGFDFEYLLNVTRGIDVEEDEPNDRVAQAVRDPGFTVFGEISNRRDVDFYSFVATAGQTLIVDVDAEVIGSRLDAEINLSDPQTGAEFFYNDQHDGDDPRFNIVLPYTGRYVIGIGSFASNSSGFYRLNGSLVPASGAPVITAVIRLEKKLIEVQGSGFTSGARVWVNGVARKTTHLNSGTLRAKVKARVGDTVTVSNPPDGRRSNPLIVQ